MSAARRIARPIDAVMSSSKAQQVVSGPVMPHPILFWQPIAVLSYRVRQSASRLFKRWMQFRYLPFARADVKRQFEIAHVAWSNLDADAMIVSEENQSG